MNTTILDILKSTDSNISAEQQKLAGEKRKLILLEARCKEAERKKRTRHLITLGGLVSKSNLGFLPKNAIYGAMISIMEDLSKDPSKLDHYTQIGANAFAAEEKHFTAAIVKFDSEPNKSIRDKIRSIGLRWNRFRKEWNGNITNLDELKTILGDLKYNLELIDDSH